ncbi:Obg family GTPase CgtA [Candidatus Kaiserbacteria bacterium RIFCSPHIGHO2_12_FULL_53_13]|uniref:GTPase Obg n=1 Tax=Candidatus Kaiserbacteria bacterium RIFCSPHIGHO2_12_FULL_53_13 TaxID=1798502 RepID=A0A1F6ECC0_9BACT|nr:MAG: Obg family GTPase CgtA [Candidatus Kaiserbacteria bacterium RIFCSPHIGHO2_12_FULL_53_13]OGG74299.1 MAG: Obg family GTPase CgtA [Candidatus Kaiserbacteria bacterium RIFCSPLOWO2_01_FULL_52_36]
MLIDDVTVKLAGGHGGRGAVAFNKVRLSQGPVGGDGGDGGSIYFEGVSDLTILIRFAHRKEISAQDGKNGRGQFIDGPRGGELTLMVPVGSTITNLDTGKVEEITKVGERVLAVKGGHGGKGNFKFRSPTNTTPMEFQEGLPGEAATFRIELKLIADVGLIGLPNAGKSSLLNELTAAKARVANYAFTTLEPNLGAYYELVLADIPGLIEGASSGKGLGIKFLKHIERTSVLFHLISAESEDPARDYEIIRSELKAHSPQLSKKIEYIFLTKTDMLAPQELKEKLAVLEKIGLHAIPISILDTASIEQVRKILNKIKSEK